MAARSLEFWDSLPVHFRLSHGMGEPRKHRPGYAQNRQRILDAALTLVVEDGPDKLSMRKLGARANFSAAGLYEYFSGREAILAELAHEGSEALRQALRLAMQSVRVARGEDPREVLLVELGVGYVQFAKEEPAYYRLLFDTPFDGETHREAMAKRPSPYHVLLAAIAQVMAMPGAPGPLTPAKGVANENAVRGPDAESVAYALWALVHGIASLAHHPMAEFSASLKGVSRDAVRLLVRGVLCTAPA